MNIEQVRRIIEVGSDIEKNNLRDYFKKYGNTLDKEEEIHNIFVETICQLEKDEVIALSGIIGYPVFVRLALYPRIRHLFPLLQDGASLVILDGENVLVQLRTDNGKYGFSGGCQELGEDLTDVAIRECYEETGLKIDKEKVICLCEVSGMSRKNSYPNGDVVVNNTALHIGYLSDCQGVLRKDFESKEVSFKPFSFMEKLPEDTQHERDFIDILGFFLRGQSVLKKQPDVLDVLLPEQSEEFGLYVSNLSLEQRLCLARKMGYEEFMKACIDERIRDRVPRLVNKAVLLAVCNEAVLVEDKDEMLTIPKRVQSVGENFENILRDSFGVMTDEISLIGRLSGKSMYNEEDNTFINAMIFGIDSLVMENTNLRYMPISEVRKRINREDMVYLSLVKSKINGKRLSR